MRVVGAAAALMLAACSRSPQRPIERIAVLPFENLSGDASLDWVAPAAPGILASELAGSAKVFPMRLETVSDAYLARATRFVHGSFTRRGAALRFEIEVEDASRHKRVTATSVDGTVTTALDTVAKLLDPAAQPFSTGNAEALAAWGHGDYPSAVMLDPDFGAAWLAWIQKLAAEGNQSRATEVAAQALERPQLHSEIDRARIDVASATLRKDAGARRAALATLVRLVTTDPSLFEALAGIELSARRFPEAAAQFRSLLRVDPANAAAMNSLGYAEACGGNLEAAKKIFEEYSRQPGQKTNALDSLGEAYFMNGRFSEAEPYFLQAYSADSRFLGGADLLKTAYARWLGGDLPGADVTMKRYLEFRTSQHDPLMVWREAVWDYATGRRERAMLKLQNPPPNVKELADRQMAIWRGVVKPPEDLSALAEQYLGAVPAVDGEVRTFYASALFAAGRKEEARKLLARWPLPDLAGDPLFQSLVYPKFLELRRAVGL